MDFEGVKSSEEQNKNSKRKATGRIPVLLLFVSVLLIAVGLLLGQNSAVYSKAVKICLECVGIG